MSETPNKIIEYHGDADKTGTEIEIVPINKIKLIDKFASSEEMKKKLREKIEGINQESGQG